VVLASGFSLPKGERVSRQPSSIYWVGLRTWELIDTQGSLRQFVQASGNRLPRGGSYPIFTDGLKRAENFGDLGLSRHLHFPVAIPRLVL